MHMLPETLAILPSVQMADFQCYSVGSREGVRVELALRLAPGIHGYGPTV